MKKSKYNIVVENGDNCILFNTLNERFVLIPSARVDEYVEILNNPDVYESDFGKFINAMRATGFLIDNDFDELDSVKRKYHAKRRPGNYCLMILPTYQCNLRCWYCTQNHQDMWMSDDTVQRVKRLIDLKAKDPSIDTISLSWFGGEPLMCYDLVVELTDYASQAASDNGKHFSCNMTTNGTLLTKERIRKLYDVGVNHYQITIDGPREVHNKIKVLGQCSAFDLTLSNINEIAKRATVTLRHNYTAETLDADRLLSDIESVLDKNVVKNVQFRPYKVWQEAESKELTDRAYGLYKKALAKGIPSKLFLPDLCYVDQYYFDCIFPNGRVGKCDNLDPQNVAGELTEDGHIVWDMKEAKYSIPILFDSILEYECESCEYLPMCWGPCAVRRESMWRGKNKISCYHNDCRSSMNQYIKNFVINKFNEP